MPVTVSFQVSGSTGQEHKPKKDDYIVCAGTVTENSVDGMSSGFDVFKTEFGFYDDPQPPWVDAVNQKIAAYNKKSSSMPAFQEVNYNSKSGGIATVPALHNDGSVKNHCNTRKTADEQYKDAIRDAIAGARAASQPLYIQPLGIGVYNWPADKAALLFAEVIEEDQKKFGVSSPLDIKIPIYLTNNTTTDKNNQLFYQTLTQKLQDKSVTVSNPFSDAAPPAPALTAPSSSSPALSAALPAAKSVVAPSSIQEKIIQDTKSKYDKEAKDPSKSDDSYKAGFESPKHLSDGRVQLKFPDDVAKKKFYTQLANEKQSFVVSNESGEVIAYSNGDGVLRGNDHQSLSATDASDWKPKVSGTNFTSFESKTIEQAKELDDTRLSSLSP